RRRNSLATRRRKDSRSLRSAGTSSRYASAGTRSPRSQRSRWSARSPASNSSDSAMRHLVQAELTGHAVQRPAVLRAQGGGGGAGLGGQVVPAAGPAALFHQVTLVLRQQGPDSLQQLAALDHRAGGVVPVRQRLQRLVAVGPHPAP